MPTKDANGWYQYTQAAGSQIVYVSKAGSDANAGTSSSAPLLTLSAGIGKLRTGTSDWLLLRKGDTWTNETFGRITLNGASADQPILVSCYDPADPTTPFPYTGGALPIVQTRATDSPVIYTDGNFNANDIGHNIAIAGIEWYSYNRDPANGTVDTTNSTCIQWANGSNGFICEGNVFRFFNGALGLQPDFNVSTTLGHVNPIVHRNIFVDGWGSAVTYLYMNGFKSATITENLWDKNGYNNSISGYEQYRWTQNHGMYVNLVFPDSPTTYYYINGPITYSGNIYARDVSSAHVRPGGQLGNNLWLQNTSGFDFGRPILGNSYSITSDVFAENVTEPYNGLPLSSVTTGSPGTFNCTSHGLSSGTIIAFDNVPSGTLPSPIAKDTPYIVSSSGLTANAFQVTDTSGTAIALTTSGSGTIVFYLVTGATNGWTVKSDQNYNGYPVNLCLETMTMTNCLFQNYTCVHADGFAFASSAHSGDPTPASVTVTNNVMYQCGYGNGNAPFSNSHGPIKDGTGASNTLTPNSIYLGAGSDATAFNNVSPSSFTDSTRTIGTYAASIGLTGTVDAFLTAARAQRKHSWNNAYMAATANDYLRAGFNMALVGGSHHGGKGLRNF